jgi:S-adenosylmethionine decarboxylase
MVYYHILGKLTGTVIETVEDLEARMAKVAEECSFTVRGRSFVQFEPVGATGVFVLAESHFSAHSYPENETVYVDVFCCSESFSPTACARCVELAFGAAHAEWDTRVRD